ncbi:MAG: hypothetical protein DRI69_05835 [Bacteroidetes bacterium]|nr:MAG: hypothetical protein DRI69_05835 [Bacteroidota bacterium]
MKGTVFSIYVFGIYMILIPGLGLIFIPELMLDLFKLSHGDVLWLPRMVGYLALAIGVYYYFIAKYKLSKLYILTVVLRYVAAAFMTVLWAMGEVGVMIFVFAVVDASGATWTILTMRGLSQADTEFNQ